jgi:hypothetical protein
LGFSPFSRRPRHSRASLPISPRSLGPSPRVPFVPEPPSRPSDRRVLRVAPLVPPADDALHGQGSNDYCLPLGPASASRRAPLQVWGQLPRPSRRSRCRLTVARYRSALSRRAPRRLVRARRRRCRWRCRRRCRWSLPSFQRSGRFRVAHSLMSSGRAADPAPLTFV